MAFRAQHRSKQLFLAAVVWVSSMMLATGQEAHAPDEGVGDEELAEIELVAAQQPLNANANNTGQSPQVNGGNARGQATGADPANRSRLTSNRRPQRSAGSNRASIPYMVGDTVGGAQEKLRVTGSASVLIEHPTFGGSRLNLAENNSPILADRLFVSYRHFHNATDFNVRSFGGVGGINSLNVDSTTLGFEKKFRDIGSLEFRLPINEQLTSNVAIAQTTGPVINIPLSNRSTTVGNLGIILKLALLSSDTWYVSYGAGLNLPTAPDVNVLYTVNDPQLALVNAVGQIQNRAINYRLNTVYSNETVNLSPFFSAYWQPQGRVYGLGFLQVDTPLSQSTVRSNGTAQVGGVPPLVFNSTSQINQQTLMRCNLGLGAWLWKNDSERLIQSLSLRSEFHYSTTLNDADLSAPTVVAPDLGTRNSVLTFGNTSGRVDLLNTVFGVQATAGKTIFTNAFVAPMRSGTDKAYDFEYNFSMNRLF